MQYICLHWLTAALRLTVTVSLFMDVLKQCHMFGFHQNGLSCKDQTVNITCLLLKEIKANISGR